MKIDVPDLRVECEVALIAVIVLQLACAPRYRDHPEAADADHDAGSAVDRTHAGLEMALGGEPIVNAGAQGRRPDRIFKVGTGIRAVSQARQAGFQGKVRQAGLQQLGRCKERHVELGRAAGRIAEHHAGVTRPGQDRNVGDLIGAREHVLGMNFQIVHVDVQGGRHGGAAADRG